MPSFIGPRGSGPVAVPAEKSSMLDHQWLQKGQKLAQRHVFAKGHEMLLGILAADPPAGTDQDGAVPVADQIGLSPGCG
jgi:hypothetical protein